MSEFQFRVIFFDDIDFGLEFIDIDNADNGLVGGHELTFVDESLSDESLTLFPVSLKNGIVEFSLCVIEDGGESGDVCGSHFDDRLLGFEVGFGDFELRLAVYSAFAEAQIAVVFAFGLIEGDLRLDKLGLTDFEIGLGLFHSLDIFGIVEFGDDISGFDFIPQVYIEFFESSADFW